MRKSMMIAVGLAMVLGLAAVQAWADAGDAAKGGEADKAAKQPATQPASDAEIAKLIGQLGSATLAERAAAQKSLVKIGHPAGLVQ